MRPAVSARRRSDSSSSRLVDATPTRLPSTKRRLTVVFDSATFWWIWLLAKRVSCSCLPSDERLGLGRARLRRERRARGAAMASGSLLSRSPSPLADPDLDVRGTGRRSTPWPTCATWPGSPLPQFGVPSIT